MMNLAGKNFDRNDKQILSELTRCGIPVAPWNSENNEVASSFCGRFHTPQGAAFLFNRAWTYWTVGGRVPLATALKIYAHPVGVTDIRVGGHCGCIPPERPYVEWRDPASDKKYARMSERADIEKFKDNYPDMYTKFMDEHLFHDDPASVGAVGTVDSYHIDSELGLYVFMQFIRGTL